MPKKITHPPAKKSAPKPKSPIAPIKNEGLERFIKVTDFQAAFNSVLIKVIKPTISNMGKKLAKADCLMRGCTAFEEEHSDISPILLKAEHLCYYIQLRSSGRGTIFVIAGNPIIQKV